MNDTYSSAQSNQSIYYNTASNASNPSNTPNANNTNTATSTPNTTANSTQQQNLPSSTNINTSNLVNDIYTQINQLSNQFNSYQNSNNEKINEINHKLNFVNESIEAIKIRLNELNQQVLLAVQASNNTPYNGYNNQNKVLEIFNKSIFRLSKEIEELTHSTALQPGQHPQLQSQHHLNPQSLQGNPATIQSSRNAGANSSNNSNNSGAANNSNNTNNTASGNQPGFTVSGEEVVDELGRPTFSKSLGIRSPAAPNSNPTSPFISNRFNFDLNSFSTTRNNNASIGVNGNGPNNNFQMQTHTNYHQISENNSPNINVTTDKSSVVRKRTKGSKKGSTHQSPTQQPPALSSTNSYILPLPTLLANDDLNSPANKNNQLAPSLSSNNNQISATAQFISVIPRPQDGTNIIPSAIRQQGNQRGFFEDEIEPNMGDLEGKSSEEGSTKGKNKKRKRELADENDPNSANGNVPQYTLEKSLKTITDIWTEYEYGLNGKPALKSLESEFGTKWRNETESRTFLRRKKIYEAIESGKRKGMTEKEVISDLEDYRSYDKNGAIKKQPLSWLCTNIPEKYSI
ncbi:hypothetical protein G9P44_005302 [Scheffersomyces stipitis]|nr:hypothetical protein G9P44_005302 [Scheffersomyces stipitis]